MAELGPDWVPGPDGIPYRRAARVILLDDADRVLLVRGHDVDQPERSWWFTVGGGIDGGETPRQAAVRELREETGIAPRLLGTRADAEEFARIVDEQGLDAAEKTAALSTWRREVIGAAWAGWLSGTVNLVGDTSADHGIRIVPRA